MPLVSRQAIEEFLRGIGFTEIAPGAFRAVQTLPEGVFHVEVQVKQAYIVVRVYLNLETQCDRFPLYEQFNQINAQKVLAKLAVAFRCGENTTHPLVFDAEIPAGPEEAYSSPVSIAIVLAQSFKAIQENYTQILNLFRQGCSKPEDERPRPEPPRNVLDLLRRMRGREAAQEGGTNA